MKVFLLGRDILGKQWLQIWHQHPCCKSAFVEGFLKDHIYAFQVPYPSLSYKHDYLTYKVCNFVLFWLGYNSFISIDQELKHKSLGSRGKLALRWQVPRKSTVRFILRIHAIHIENLNDAFFL